VEWNGHPVKQVSDPTPAASARPKIHLAVLESGPLRRLGYHEAFASDALLHVHEGTEDEVLADPAVQVLLLGRQPGGRVFERVGEVRQQRPDLRILVAGSHGDDETIVRCLQAGAKGYIDEASPIAEFQQAIHIVGQGSIWAPRRLLSLFIDRVLQAAPGSFMPAKLVFTPREREVLELLVGGQPNREIARHMGIEERTVKAHVAKLLRKVGVPNRIALTMHTINHALLGIDKE